MEVRMEKYLIDYREELEDQGLALSTMQTYINSARRFAAFSDGRTITKKLVREYHISLEEQGYKPATINLYMIAVNKFLRFCHLENCMVKITRLQQRQSLPCS